jgi:hypothetical protein
MEIYIEIMLLVLLFWMVANFWIRFMPLYVIKLPVPVYEFLYIFTGAGENISHDPTGFYSPEPNNVPKK